MPRNAFGTTVRMPPSSGMTAPDSFSASTLRSCWSRASMLSQKSVSGCSMSKKGKASLIRSIHVRAKSGSLRRFSMKFRTEIVSALSSSYTRATIR